MVYITFPANLTEEEQMLQTKYQKLKKKVKISIQNPYCIIFYAAFNSCLFLFVF